MSAYADFQEREFASEALGYTATRHQREVGTGYFDEVAERDRRRPQLDDRVERFDGGRAVLRSALRSACVARERRSGTDSRSSAISSKALRSSSCRCTGALRRAAAAFGARARANGWRTRTPAICRDYPPPSRSHWRPGASSCRMVRRPAQSDDRPRRRRRAVREDAQLRRAGRDARSRRLDGQRRSAITLRGHRQRDRRVYGELTYVDAKRGGNVVAIKPSQRRCCGRACAACTSRRPASTHEPTSARRCSTSRCSRTSSTSRG